MWYGKHQLVRFRYALLVDTATGRLDTLVWMVGPDGRLAEKPEIGWLRPDTVDHAELVVDRDQIEGGIPKFGADGALAVEGLPPVREKSPLPAEIRGLAAQTRFTAPEARALEAALRKLIAGR